MPSGLKTSIINTQERAISTDINRLQAFAGAGLGELLRYLLNVGGNDDLNAGAIAIEQNSFTAPLSAQIVNGLLVRPQNGNLSLFVDPGVIAAIAPDTDPDSSAYKIIKDAGISAFGVLPITAGQVGGTRIDIVEVQVASVVTEFDNRDEFNQTTGLFAPTNVPKARQGSVTGTGNIRVRAGTPGGAFPGTVAGWLPLAVASVPTAATSCDGMTFWDVRPLINDLAFGVSGLVTDRPIINPGVIDAMTLNHAEGWTSAVLNSRRIGGRLRRGSAGTDTDFLDLTAAENRENGFTPTVGIWSLYFCTPFGLPRWARYTDASAGSRVPRSPRGIPIMSMVPIDPDGRPVNPISLPVALGLGSGAAAQQNEAVSLASSWVSSITNLPLGFTMDGRFIQPTFNAANGVILQTFSTTSNTQGVSWTPNIHYPGNARRLQTTIQLGGASNTATGIVTAEGFDVGVSTGISFINYITGFQVTTGTPYTILGTAMLSVPSAYPSRIVPTLQRYNIAFLNLTGTIGVTCLLTGWEVG